MGLFIIGTRSHTVARGATAFAAWCGAACNMERGHDRVGETWIPHIPFPIHRPVPTSYTHRFASPKLVYTALLPSFRTISRVCRG